MIRRLLIVFFLSVWSFAHALSQTADKDSLLRDQVRKYGQAEVTLPYPGAKEMDILTRNVSIVSVRNKAVIINISFRTIEWFIAAKYNYSVSERIEPKGLVSASSVDKAMEWQSYPTYTQYDSIMRSFSTLYPSICHLDTIGTSIDGRYIFALKISDNPALSEDEPKVFYTSTMHGDELAGFVLMLRLADYLLKNYNLNSRVKNMVDNLEIWINPNANPDGTYTTGNTITNPTRENANGYDLNRNFPDPFTPNTTKQKETLDMIKFMRKHHFTISANYHSGSEVVNYPWDRWLSKIHADNAWFNSISRAFVDTIHKYSGPAYMSELDNGVTRGALWYIVYGGRQDFTTWELQGREVTIEIDDIKETPAAQLELMWQYNWRSFLGYLENALYGIHGIVRDAHTSGPIAARVFIAGHDIDSSQVYSDTLYGRFVRMLYPGTWNLTFSAAGYRDTTINNVPVIAGQRTDLIVEMKSITSSIDTANPEVPLLYPDPASIFIMAKLPEKLSGMVKIQIYNQSGARVADFVRNYDIGFPLEINVAGLSGGGYIIVFTNTGSGVTFRSRFIVTGKSR